MVERGRRQRRKAAGLQRTSPAPTALAPPCHLPFPTPSPPQIIHYPCNHHPARNAAFDLIAQLSGRRPDGAAANAAEVLLFYGATLGLSLVRPAGLAWLEGWTWI